MTFSSELNTKRLKIRQIKPSDFQFFKTLHLDPIVTKYLPEIPLTATALKLSLESRLNKWDGENSDPLTLVVILKNSKEPIGIINFHRAYMPEKPKIKMGEISYLFLPQYWRKGYASEALYKVLLLLKKMKFIVVRGIVPNNNIASTSFLLKNGFKRTNVVSEFYPIKGTMVYNQTFGICLSGSIFR